VTQKKDAIDGFLKHGYEHSIYKPTKKTQ